MSKPQDQICCDNIEKLPNGCWSCKFCDAECSGIHGQEEALQMTPMKRARYSSDGEDDVDDRAEVAVAMATENGSSSDGVIASRSSEYVTDALVKFLVNMDASVNVFKNSHFRTFLRRVAQHGVPSCLFRDDSLRVQRSVWNLEHEVNEYIMKVKESWKTTGCTMMLYKLNGKKGNLSSLDKDNLVFGFYSPKGFFFVEGRTLAHSDDIRGAFKNHVLNLPTEEVTQVIYHSFNRDNEDYQPCELAYEASAPYDTWLFDLREESRVPRMHCLQQVVHQLCRKICRTSGWVQNRIKTSEKIHDYILNTSLYLDWGKEKVEMVLESQGCSFRRLRSIMELEYELKTWLLHLPLQKMSCLDTETGIPTIINSLEFWHDGRELVGALDLLFQIPDLVDTLVPTAGFMKLATDDAKSRREFAKNQTVTQCYDDFLKGYHLSETQELATFLRPGYYMYQAEEDLGLINYRVKRGLESIAGKEERQALYAELEDYNCISSNPFANLNDDDICWENHPVTLWNKYGGEFPLLKKCAIKALSQPVSCMCKQVKKHMSQIQGTDNFILRLNFKMMEEFHKLGDGIYRVLDI